MFWFVSRPYFCPVDAFSQAPFYQGKTVTVVISTSPGGTGDLRVKALLPFLRKHIPGNPTVLLGIYGRRRRPQSGELYVSHALAPTG